MSIRVDGEPFSRLREKVAGGAGRMRADERFDVSGLIYSRQFPKNEAAAGPHPSRFA